MELYRTCNLPMISHSGIFEALSNHRCGGSTGLTESLLIQRTSFPIISLLRAPDVVLNGEVYPEYRYNTSGLQPVFHG